MSVPGSSSSISRGRTYGAGAYSVQKGSGSKDGARGAKRTCKESSNSYLHDRAPLPSPLKTTNHPKLRWLRLHRSAQQHVKKPDQPSLRSEEHTSELQSRFGI